MLLFVVTAVNANKYGLKQNLYWIKMICVYLFSKFNSSNFFGLNIKLLEMFESHKKSKNLILQIV